MDALTVLYRRRGPWWLVLLCGLASHAARTAEADRERAALLAAVSHDLRTPLAAAKAAISGLRSPHARLSAGDRDELLASAEESLDQLTRLAASLLDVSRLQAGAHAVFSRPADLGQIIADTLDIIADTLDGLGSQGNALRYSAPASPPLLTARARGDWVELRVVDHGPGIPETDRQQAFLPFCRLGDPDSRTGTGLGLTVSRSLAEAMGGTVEPEETPGGGLTMVISLPAAPARPAAGIGAVRRIQAA